MTSSTTSILCPSAHLVDKALLRRQGRTASSLKGSTSSLSADIGSPRGLCEVKVYVLLHALTSEIRQTVSIQNNKLTSAYMQICTYTKKCAIYITCE